MSSLSFLFFSRTHFFNFPCSGSPEVQPPTACPFDSNAYAFQTIRSYMDSLFHSGYQTCAPSTVQENVFFPHITVSYCRSVVISRLQSYINWHYIWSGFCGIPEIAYLLFIQILEHYTFWRGLQCLIERTVAALKNDFIIKINLVHKWCSVVPFPLYLNFTLQIKE